MLGRGWGARGGDREPGSVSQGEMPQEAGGDAGGGNVCKGLESTWGPRDVSNTSGA